MSREEKIIKTIYHLLLISDKKLPSDYGGTTNSEFWEFMRDYSTWQKEGLRYFNKTTGKFDGRGYVEIIKK